MRGEQDGLKEAKEQVHANDLTHLSAELDKAKKEIADLQGKIPSSAQPALSTSQFSFAYHEPLSQKVHSIAWLMSPMWIYILLKIVSWAMYLLDWAGISVSTALITIFSGRGFVLAMNYTPFVVLLWTCYYSLSLLPGKTNWRLYWYTTRKAVFYTLYASATMAFSAHLFQLDSIEKEEDIDTLRYRAMFEVAGVIFLFLIRRFIRVDYQTLTVTEKYRHKYTIAHKSDFALTSDLRTEAMKRGKLVYMDNKEAVVTYTKTKTVFFKITGVDVENGDDVSEEWEIAHDPKKTVGTTHTFRASLEMLAQLNHLAVMLPSEKSVAYERIEYAAKNIVSVNTDRFDFMSGDHYLLYTVALAKGLYESQREEVLKIPF